MKNLVFTFTLLIATLCSTTTFAETRTFQGLAVDVRGQGQAVIMLPGLNSAGATWTETCEALQPVECHIIQLPGFAGLATVTTAEFLPAMRDRIIAYIEQAALEQPVLLGHSLGGTLSLMIALERPSLASKLVIVDTLPFYAAIQQPQATAASMQPVAEAMRKGMLEQPEEQYRARANAMLGGMTRSEERLEQLQGWSETSDRHTTANAMFDLMTTDLRQDLAKISSPTLVLGSWAAYSQYGATEASTAAIFEDQYAALNALQLHLSDHGYHFLMWDDPEWLVDRVQQFLTE
jgi:pimeloyl-ACP methyl ester carboxylesterase